ncbi:hypothetical protein FB45DRAFT_1036701 [Roridomyces roridus]|uniref:Uncharacterized protein n=1 Tax=Roridomyces roridus TaxID=1738132 RepID=A0AAD7B8H0_9AGAR|nr:hypothetical protein FB45DRAFT_1036701 [Roridomyces roridus]
MGPLRSINASANKRVDPFDQNDDDCTLAVEALHLYSVLYPDITTVAGHSMAGSTDDRTKARRAYLENELRAAQEKIAHISPQVLSPGHTRLRALARIGTGRSETVAQLREQNATYQARIRELEAHMTSPWALGLSDEPPPGYEEGVGPQV